MKKKVLTIRQVRNHLAKQKKELAEPEPGDLRGQYRPTKTEFKMLLKNIQQFKSFIVKRQAYELASKVREIEKYIIEVRDSHPEQKQNEVFIMNIKNGEDWKTSKLPDWIESLRIGKKAYVTDFSKIVKNYKPMFAILKNKKNA